MAILFNKLKSTTFPDGMSYKEWATTNSSDVFASINIFISVVIFVLYMMFVNDLK